MNTKVSFVTKLYIWSLIFESLLYFVLGSQQNTGINTSFGRILQTITILLLSGYFISRIEFKLPNPLTGHFKMFTYLFLFSILSAIFGILTEGYTFRYVGNYNAGFATSAIAKFLRSAFVRPILEYVIYFFYITYFVVMPFYMIKTEKALFYFFKMFRRMFMIGLVIGLLDLLTSLAGFQFLARDMMDVVYVGFRFHGFAGEPRDAFVYLFYSYCVFNIESIYKTDQLLSKKYSLGIIGLMLLTQSASGLLGVLIGGILILGMVFSKVSIKQLIYGFLMAILVISFVVVGVLSSERIMSYIEVISLVYEALEEELPPPLVFVGQMNNIYPIWDMYVKAKNFNIFPLLVGSGFGSASVANNNWGYFLWSELMNPHSQIVRILYETGIIGLGLYIVTIFKQAKIHTIGLSDSKRKFFMYTMLLLIGMSLAHRSTTIFIYTGILIMTMTMYRKKIALLANQNLKEN
ncbi:hypothetical protein [Aquirufa salirivi]|uniref:hypothetical protein n=1 Tax=Aquirufa salirivi TaxID=3104729 RepID=UPI003877E201